MTSAFSPRTRPLLAINHGPSLPTSPHCNSSFSCYQSLLSLSQTHPHILSRFLSYTCSISPSLLRFHGPFFSLSLYLFISLFLSFSIHLSNTPLFSILISLYHIFLSSALSVCLSSFFLNPHHTLLFSTFFPFFLSSFISTALSLCFSLLHHAPPQLLLLTSVLSLSPL